MPMIEVAAAMTAEQVAERSAYGVLLGRRGERGVYRCAPEGDDTERWIALDVDADPLPPEDRAVWCETLSTADAVSELLAEGIAAAAMVPAYAALDDPQLVARGFFERVEHPIVGEQHYPGWPMRFSAGPERYWTAPAPMLGQHTEEVLRERLGLTDADLDALRARDVIGTVPLGTV